MNAFVRLYSDIDGEISKFLEHFYQKQLPDLKNNLLWEKEYKNPIKIADIISVLTENHDKFKVNMWISLDHNLYINVTHKNADDIIRYLYERYPY